MSDAQINSLTGPVVTGLRTTLRGELIQPGDETYDALRAVYNSMIDRRPRLIARCVNAADVITVVNFARAHELALAVRGGGHNVAGFGVCDDGLVIDLSLMKSVRVDPKQYTARAEGGCTWGDFDHATHAFGLATPGGLLSTTGIAGLTLGGGFGYLSRKYGLSCDNLISADVVTGDGRFLTASEQENEDLFWGLRGGGGNFGVVTSFEFRLHPVSMVYGGPVFYPVERSEEVMRFYRDFIAQAPKDLSAFLGFHVAPPAPFVPEPLQGVPVCAIGACYTGPMEKAEEAVRPIRECAPPALDLMGALPYPALNSMFDALLPPGLQHYWKADFVEELTDEAIAVHLQYGPRVPNFMSFMHLYPLEGAAQQVDRHETAYSYRDARFVHVIAGIDSDPTAMPAHTAWVRDYWSALHPLSAGGAYVNFLMEEGEDRIRATYRDNYERLVELKRKYDSANLFRLNQNINPMQAVA
jgi:UDP-N-acetylenolpyruvoylglucosamine reductase